ncbi:polysaccharide deacetylase family protein [Legionella waltersii]|uniref:Polysaccharide deacetylase n=1 Tax=Legionella waltersii TaxID=66969 RepID=A0A0W1ANN0_9GAMM|nr:polysaccharide deacetylase family protein [Legionella waltersii]KTD82932.1 polysaccharide deacetylase [Legionella waltersii]SNV02374.1 polysaccharide deacetylase [Legionella waltersii]
MLTRWLGVFTLLCFIYVPCFAEETEVHEIALTLDDLPFVGSGTSTPGNLKRTQERFDALVNTLVEKQVPATGFAIAGAIGKHEWEFLELFKSKGFELGNHTFKHKSLNSMTAEKYIADIEHADEILTPVMTSPKYFRYPYLAEGNGEKKEKVHEWLFSHQYIIAPVTVDSKDYEFNAQFYRIAYRQRPARLPQFKKRYLAFIWQQTLRAEKKAEKLNGKPIKHILLLHANLLNSLCLADIIEMYKSKGYKFITLDEALKANAALKLDNSITVPEQEKVEQPGTDVSNPT